MLPRHQSMMVAFATLAFGVPILAADWPQWLGPNRDGIWNETGILDKLPKDGPKVLWKKPIDGGYTGPAVVNGRIYVMDRAKKEKKDPMAKGLPGTERVICLDLKTGNEIWKHEYDRTYMRVDRPMGPRTTPVVDGDRVYTLGSMGDLYCLDAKTGKPVWNKYFADLYGEVKPIWGYSAHLLVHNDLVIALAGCGKGGEGKAVVAFDKATGKEKWSALSTNDVGYSPPVLAEAGGVKQLIVWLSDKIAGLNPDTGEVYWSFTQPAKSAVPKGMPTVTIITPKVVGEMVYISDAYHGMCAVKLNPEPKKAEVAWRANLEDKKGPDMLSVLMTTLIAKDGHLYGLDGNTGEVVCISAKDGKEVWRSMDLFGGKKAEFGSCFWVENGDKVFTFIDNGDLAILKLNPKGYEEVSRAHVMDPVGADRGRKVIWSHPAFSDKKMIFRNEKEIVCVSLAKE